MECRFVQEPRVCGKAMLTVCQLHWITTPMMRSKRGSTSTRGQLNWLPLHIVARKTDQTCHCTAFEPSGLRSRIRVNSSVTPRFQPQWFGSSAPLRRSRTFALRLSHLTVRWRNPEKCSRIGRGGAFRETDGGPGRRDSLTRKVTSRICRHRNLLSRRERRWAVL